MLINSSYLMLNPISIISERKALCGLLDISNVTIWCAAKKVLIAGREALPSDTLSKYSNLLHNEDPVYSDYFLYGRVETSGNGVSGCNILGTPSAYLSKVARESLADSCTRHQ